MSRRSISMGGGLALLVLVALSANLAGAPPPTIKAIWILPTEFNVDGKPQPSPAPDFATPGEKLLQAIKDRAPLLSTPQVLMGPNANRSKVMATMQETLDSLTPGSILLFYYAGHGIHLGGGSNPATNTGATYLAMQDCEVGRGKPTYDNMILLAELMDLQARYEHVYFMGYIDACYSGNASLMADTMFWSAQLGYRAFLLCSTTSTRLSYGSDFTKALTSVYQRDELFKQIHNPNDIYNLTLSSYSFQHEQLVTLIPKNANLYVTYPLPDLCFYYIDFGGLIQKEIIVDITPPNGKTTRCKFNDRGQAIGLVAFTVQQLDNIQITVNVDSQNEKTFTVNLAGKVFDHKLVGGLGSAKPITQTNADDTTFRAAAAEFQSVISRAKAFGLSDDNITDLGAPLLTSYFGKLEFATSGSVVAEQAKFLAETAPNSERTPALRLIAGLDSPSNDRDGMSTMERAFLMKVPIPPSIAAAYTKNIQTNVALLQEDSNAAWIKPEELIDKIRIAARAAKDAKDADTYAALQDTVRDLDSPRNRILSKRDLNDAVSAAAMAPATTRPPIRPATKKSTFKSF